MEEGQRRIRDLKLGVYPLVSVGKFQPRVIDQPGRVASEPAMDSGSSGSLVLVDGVEIWRCLILDRHCH